MDDLKAIIGKVATGATLSREMRNAMLLSVYVLALLVLPGAMKASSRVSAETACARWRRSSSVTASSWRSRWTSARRG